MEKRILRASFAELDFFKVYRESISNNLAEIRKEYSLKKGDIEIILNRVEEDVCGVHSFFGDLTKTARQCRLPEKVVRKILEKRGKFISNSKIDAYEFLYKREKF